MNQEPWFRGPDTVAEAHLYLIARLIPTSQWITPDLYGAPGPGRSYRFIFLTPNGLPPKAIFGSCASHEKA